MAGLLERMETADLLALRSDLTKYDDSEPRDARGRWTVDVGDFTARAEAIFGKTDDMQQASFLLPDGSMLARKDPEGWRSGLANYSYHHTEVIDVAYADRPPSARPSVNALMQAGVVRLNARWGGWLDVEMGMKPLTSEQSSALREAAEGVPRLVLEVSRGERDGGYNDAAYVGSSDNKPVYEVIREANQAALGKIFKYSPEQLRDDHGRWTSAGDSTYLSPEDATRQLQAMWPQARVGGFTTTNRILLHQAVHTLAELHRRYPDVAPTQIAVVRSGLGSGRDTIASVTAGRLLALNEPYWKNGLVMARQAASERSLRPEGMSPAEAVMIHEFGHMIDHQYFAGNAGVGAALPGYYGLKDTIPQVSTYAGTNSHEAWAEGFLSYVAGQDTPAARWVSDRLSAIGKILKYDPGQPRDSYGRWTAGAGFEGTPEQQAARAAFATLPRGSLKNAATQRWFAAHADLYRSNVEFRKLVAASSAYAQGHYSELRGAAVYGMTGELPPSEGMNAQAWKGYLTGTPWRNDFGPAPEGSKDGEHVLGYPGSPGFLVSGGRLTSDEDYPAPTFGLAPDIMAYAKSENDGGTGPFEAGSSPEQISYKDAGLALNTAIAASDPVDGELYRGLRLDRENAISGSNYKLGPDGSLLGPETRIFQTGPDGQPVYDEKGWSQLYTDFPRETLLSVGQTIDLVGPTSFTADDSVAERIASGRQQMGDLRPAAGAAGLVFKVEDGAQALNIGGVSPYRQSEFLTNGKFTVTDISKEMVPAGYNAYSPRWDRPDYIPVFTVTLKQEGTWQPPAS